MHGVAQPGVIVIGISVKYEWVKLKLQASSFKLQVNVISESDKNDDKELILEILMI